MTKFNMGEKSAKETNKSTMVVESHITYNKELKEGDEVEINLIYFNHDKKRLQYKFEMIHKTEKYLASTMELLALYVDLEQRKVAEYWVLKESLEYGLKLNKEKRSPLVHLYSLCIVLYKATS